MITISQRAIYFVEEYNDDRNKMFVDVITLFAPNRTKCPIGGVKYGTHHKIRGTAVVNFGTLSSYLNLPNEMSGYNKEHRQCFILSILQRDGRVNVLSLAKGLDVNERTIRRDLKVLERKGILSCCYGGAYLTPNEKFSVYEKKPLSLHKDMKMFNKIEARGAERYGKVFVLGSFNTDLVYQVRDFPVPGETIQALDCKCFPGGKGSNQAIACAAAKATTYFAVKLGDDEFALKAVDYLQRSGLDGLIHFHGEDCATGSAVVMVSKGAGDNMITISPGANQLITRDEVLSCKGEIETADIFLTQMEINFPAVLLALQIACKKGIPTILDPAPWRNEILDILTFVDYLTPNITEAEAIVKRKLVLLDDIRDAAEFIYQAGVRHVIVTMGEKGCWHYDGCRHRHFKSFPAVNVDTSGAGDAFNGALAARLAAGDGIDAAIIYASAFASLSVEREGASNMPEHELVLKRTARTFY